MTTFAIIGTGNVGTTIGRKASAAGLDIVFGVRSADAVAPARVLGVAEAIAAADAVVIAIPGAAVGALLAEHGAALDGRLVIDASNNIGGPSLHSRDLVAAVPGVRYARAFNTVGWENFDEPMFDGEQADLFYAAETEDRAVLEELIRAVGLRPIALGGSAATETVDGLAPVWFALAGTHGRRIALRALGL